MDCIGLFYILIEMMSEADKDGLAIVIESAGVVYSGDLQQWFACPNTQCIKDPLLFNTLLIRSV